MPDTTLTIVGNLTADPELRFTPSGGAVATFTIASTPRTFDKTTQEWKDGEALFIRCTVWRDAAEHAAESLTKGTRVIATGRLKSRTWETKDGEKRTNLELDVDEVGPSLRYATARPEKAQRVGAPSPQGADADPWSHPGATNSPSGQSWTTGPMNGPQSAATQIPGGGWDEPPF